jgi:hypothetical protein
VEISMGVGRVYQLTAVDTATRWSVMLLMVGPPAAKLAAHFVDYGLRRFTRLGVRLGPF